MNGAVRVALDTSAIGPRLAASAGAGSGCWSASRSPRHRRRGRPWCSARRGACRSGPQQLAEALAEATAAREARAADLARLQAILDSMADGVLFIDAEDRVALVNQAGPRAAQPDRRRRAAAPRLPPEGLARRCWTA